MLLLLVSGRGYNQFWMKSYPAIWGLFHKPWNTDPIFKPQIDHLTGAKTCCRSISPRKVRPADHRSSHLQVRRAGWDGWAGHPQGGSQGGNRIWMVRTGSWYLAIANVAKNPPTMWHFVNFFLVIWLSIDFFFEIFVVPPPWERIHIFSRKGHFFEFPIG